MILTSILITAAIFAGVIIKETNKINKQNKNIQVYITTGKTIKQWNEQIQNNKINDYMKYNLTKLDTYNINKGYMQ